MEECRPEELSRGVCAAIIRPMAYKDVVQVAGIERVSFPTPWSARAFYDELSLPFDYSLVAEIPCRIKGLIGGYITSWLVPDEAMVLKIATHPEYRRKGLASRLMKQTLQYFQKEGITKVWLEVRQSNYAAQSFYQAHGFSYQYIRKGYYRDTGENALVMLRHIMEREEWNK